MEPTKITLSEQDSIKLDKFCEKLQLLPNEVINFALCALYELDKAGKVKVHNKIPTNQN